MNSAPSARPAGVTVIAWLWIATGGFMLVSGLAAIFAAPRVGSADGGFVMSLVTAPDSSVLGMFFRHLIPFAVLQSLVGAFAVVAAVELLRLRAWARLAMEALSWVSLVYVLVNGVLVLYLWDAVVADMPPGLVSIEPGQLHTMGLIVDVVVTVLLAAPVGVTVKYLRSAPVRRAIAANHNRK